MIKVSSCKKLFPANKTLYFSTEKRWRWGHSSVKVTIGNLKRISWRQMTWKHLCRCFYYFITWFWSNWGQTLMWGRSPAVFQLHSGLFSSFIPDSFWLHFILCDCDSRSPHLCTIFSGRTKRWMDKSLLSVSWSAAAPPPLWSAERSANRKQWCLNKRVCHFDKFKRPPLKTAAFLCCSPYL